jgi:hypothetical protein
MMVMQGSGDSALLTEVFLLFIVAGMAGGGVHCCSPSLQLRAWAAKGGVRAGERAVRGRINRCHALVPVCDSRMLSEPYRSK